MSDQRLHELERWRASTEIVLGQLQRDIETRGAEADVERGRLFASIAKQLKAMLDQIEPLRSELAQRLEAQQKYDDLNELRFDLLRSEIRRLDQQQRESERDSWHETTGLRELEELSTRARQQRSITPPPVTEVRRRRDTPPPDVTGKHGALELVPEPPTQAVPSMPTPAPPTTPPPTTTAQAGVQLARIVFSDQSVSVRFVAVLTLLVVALTVLLFALRAALPALG